MNELNFFSQSPLELLESEHINNNNSYTTSINSAKNCLNTNNLMNQVVYFECLTTQSISP